MYMRRYRFVFNIASFPLRLFVGKLQRYLLCSRNLVFFSSFENLVLENQFQRAVNLPTTILSTLHARRFGHKNFKSPNRVFPSTSGR
jgi:hypothetical protein